MINTVDCEKFPEKEIRVYRIRWIILILYVFAFGSITLHWVQYTIIADTVAEYYEVTYEAVNWTAMVFLLSNAVFCLGGSYIINVLGLRNAILLGTFLASLGSWIKIASVSPDRFWVVIVSQTVTGASQVVVMASPPKLAASWFGPKEVSSAFSMGFLGGQMGIAVGFFMPPMLVGTNRETVEQGMYTMVIAVAILNTVVLLLTFIFFQDHPPSPPSQAELLKGQKQKATNFVQSLKQLFSNSSYVCFVFCFCIDAGLYFAVSQLLNEIILVYYPNAAVEAGITGLVFTTAGIISAIVCGVMLDRCSIFREIVIAVFALTCISMLIFTFTIDKGIEVVYVVSGILGFFMTALFPAGFELAVELTYPVEETTSAGLALFFLQIFGILLTYLYSTLLNNIGCKITNAIMSGLLVIGTILLFFVRFELRRSAAQKQDMKPKLLLNNLDKEILLNQ